MLLKHATTRKTRPKVKEVDVSGVPLLLEPQRDKPGVCSRFQNIPSRLIQDPALLLAPGELLERHKQRLGACTSAAPRPDPCTAALRAWLEAPAPPPPPHLPAAGGNPDRGPEGADEEPPATLLVSGPPRHPGLVQKRRSRFRLIKGCRNDTMNTCSTASDLLSANCAVRRRLVQSAANL